MPTDSAEEAFFEDGIEIITEYERISIEFNRCYETRGRTGIERTDMSYDSALHFELEHWLSCLESRKQPTVVTAQDGVESVRLAESVIEAGKQTYS